MSFKALPDSTKHYSEQHPNIRYHLLGQTGLFVSDVGFGCYRIHPQENEHKKSLKKALLSGVNLIDISANYTDGGAEQCVGKVLKDLVIADQVKRDDLVIVTKGGYIQGQNWDQLQKQGEQSYPDLVMLQEGLAHCIHPTFLKDQLTQSLDRLNMSSVDVYLLHNPEYYLRWAKDNGLDLEEARDTYYDRIQLACAYLEEEVEKGRIQYYGISSNTFVNDASDPEFTSLERVLASVRDVTEQPHFQVIQCPMNLYETGAATCLNNSGQSVLSLAKETGIGVLINRPLNAVHQGRLTRLADIERKKEVTEDEVKTALDLLVAYESSWGNVSLDHLDIRSEDVVKLQQMFSLGTQIAKEWTYFEEYEQWKSAVEYYILPHIEHGLSIISHIEGLSEDNETWFKKYIEQIMNVVAITNDYYKNASYKKIQAIKEKIQTLVPGWHKAGRLSQVALRALRTTEGVSSTLIGMRQESYVNDVLEECHKSVSDEDQLTNWQNIQRLS